MFVVTGTDPANGAVIHGLSRLRVMLSAPVDETTLAEGVSLITADYDMIELTRLIPEGEPDVIELIPITPLDAGEYRLIVSARLTSQFGERLNTGDAGVFFSAFTLRAPAASGSVGVPVEDLSYQIGALTTVPETHSYGLTMGEAAVVFNEAIDLIKIVSSHGENLADVLNLNRGASAQVLDGNTLFLSWPLQPNYRYLFDVAVRGKSSGQAASFKLEYYSYLDPGYVTVNQIRNDIGGLVKAVPNLTIFLLISDCSQLADALVQAAGSRGLPSHKLALKQYTRFVVEYRLLREFVMLGLNEDSDQKSLGAFSVKHEGVMNPKVVDVLEKLQKDVLHWEDVLVGFAGIGPVAPGGAVKGARVYMRHPWTGQIIRDDHRWPINDPYIPSRVHLPQMWEPRFKRSLP